MSIINNSSINQPYQLAKPKNALTARLHGKSKPERRSIQSTQATLRPNQAKPADAKNKADLTKATSANAQSAKPNKALDFLTEKVIAFCTVNATVPLAASPQDTQALAQKLQPFLDVPLEKDPIKAQKQLYLAGNALISKFRALDAKNTQPLGLVAYRGQDEFLQDIEMPSAVIMHKAQHPVTHVAYAETVLRCDLPRGTPPAFGLKLLEPGWVFAASALDPFYAKGQPEKASLKSAANNLFKNFQKPPKDSIEFSRDEFDSVMLNAHSIPLALKPKDDLERTSYGVQLFKMMNNIAKTLKKHAPKASAEAPQAACQLGIVARNKKSNQLEFHNITPEFRRLFQD
ncbi:hypothetical protein [Vampirovibrio sp.]|uniref:hypothetical protein n=1 Tax=Vampirovibrio sp. TaxID=2717857 RepID=UPI0035943EFB